MPCRHLHRSVQPWTASVCARLLTQMIHLQEKGALRSGVSKARIGNCDVLTASGCSFRRPNEREGQCEELPSEDDNPRPSAIWHVSTFDLRRIVQNDVQQGTVD